MQLERSPENRIKVSRLRLIGLDADGLPHLGSSAAMCGIPKQLSHRDQPARARLRGMGVGEAFYYQLT